MIFDIAFLLGVVLGYALAWSQLTLFYHAQENPRIIVIEEDEDENFDIEVKNINH